MELSQDVRKATDPIYKKISKVMPEIEWSIHAPYIHKINELKKKRMQLFLPITTKHQKFIMVLQIFQLTH